MQNDLIKKDDKETSFLAYLFAIILGVIVLCVCVKLFYTIQNKRYKQCCDNPPTEEWFDKEIEKVVLTNEFEIVEIKNDGAGQCVVLVKVHYHDEYSYNRIQFKVIKKNGSAWWQYEKFC